MSQLPAKLRNLLDKELGGTASLPEALVQLVTAGVLAPPVMPLPGSGATMERFEALAALASFDLVLARLAEGHADALAILAEAGRDAPVESSPVLLGVWAAGPPDGLRAREERCGYLLEGAKSWCSGAGTLTHALVTAQLPSTLSPSLFLVPLTEGDLRIDRSSWRAIGMARSDTFDVQFDGLEVAKSALLGEPGWYLERPGFWHGGAGVAACWWGGARAVSEALFRRLSGSDDLLLQESAGRVAAELFAMEAALAQVAGIIDDDPTDKAGRTEEAARLVRAVVEGGAARILRVVDETLGAGPLCKDADHAQKVADLAVYIRQHHGPRDHASLGRQLAERGWTPA